MFSTTVLAQGRDDNFYRSERAFNRLQPDLKVMLQLFITAGGYWPAVPNQTYSLRLHREIMRFQRDMGLPSRGIQTGEEAVALMKSAANVMEAWDLKRVYHPTRPYWITVPAGLGLTATSLNGGIRLKSSLGRFLLEFITLNRGAATVTDAFDVLKAEMVRAGDTIVYETLKDNFFVIHGEQGRHKRYSRYHLDGAYITGFDMYWSGDGPPIYGDRLVTIVSGSLWSSMTGAPYPDFDRFHLPWEREERVPYARNEKPERSFPTPPKEEEPKKTSTSSGTGFFVTKQGHVITNEHVIDTCSVIDVTPPGRDPLRARVIAADKKNDLAVLKIASTDHSVAKIRLGTRLGETVAVFGYPLSRVLSTSGNFTLGNITALAGLGDDPRYMQISAPVQSGNSGGPLLDESGNVVGVVAAKMDALVAMKELGDLPQNVNFAIKTTTLTNFLDVNAIPYEPGNMTDALKASDLAERAKDISVFVRCH